LCLARLRSGADSRAENDSSRNSIRRISRAIQTKLEHIFQLSKSLPCRAKPKTAMLRMQWSARFLKLKEIMPKQNAGREASKDDGQTQHEKTTGVASYVS